MKKDLISMNLYKTLLDDDLKIDDYTIKVIEECKNKGSKILINTSHSYNEVLKYKKIINPDFISCFNGNYILSDENIYFSNPLKKGEVKEIIDEVLKNDDLFIIECLNTSYRNRIDKYDFIETIYSDINKINFDDCFSITIFSDNIDYVKKICKKYDLVIIYKSFLDCYKIYPKKSEKSNVIDIINKFFYDEYNIISFGNDKTDYETLKKSNIGIKMKNSNGLDNINFWTSSNNDSGVAKFLTSFYNLDLKANYDKVKILDCTLRDGGHLNNCEFGYSIIKKIIQNLSNSNIDIIEIGFLEDCIYDKNKTRFNYVYEANNLLSEIDLKNSIISLLVQVDKYDINKLENCDGYVKMIRVSFHKEYLNKAIKYCKLVKKKGYICSLNPINFSGYNNLEIIELIKKVNEIDIDYFSIVDTFGLLLNNDFNNKLNLINNLLRNDINVGLHLHDNLSSAFGAAQILMQKNTRYKNVIIDSAVLGMGRNPGNLKTELITYYLNTYSDKKYKMKYIYELMENEVLNFKKIYDWKPDFSYSISAFEKTHRTYAEYLKNKKIGYEQIEKYIKEIPLEHRVRYNEKIIENILEEGE